MSSSTSSFKTEVKVFLVVLIVLGTLELYQRYYFVRVDPQAAFLHSFPTIADRLAAESGTSAILLGNSLTQNGYDMPRLKAALDAAGHADLHIEKVAVSGSNPIEWYHYFRRSFVERGKAPSAIVINMSPSGICDELPAGYRIGWLANETDLRDIPEVLSDLKSSEVGGQYLQARVSMLYANRWDIRAGILVQFIPNAWAGMNWVNNAQPKPKAVPGAVAPPKTYSMLRRFLELARAHHVHTVLVAMPSRDGYEIEPGMPPILKEYGVSFLDCRKITGLTATGFEDSWHLNPEGAKVFTAEMAVLLSDALKPALGGQTSK